MTATLDAYPDWRIPARVKAVVPAADRQKATVRVRVEFLERDPRVLPEMGISVRFLEPGSDAAGDATNGAPKRLPAVPADAVFERGGRDYVWRIDHDRVELRAVELGARTGRGVVVTAGVSPGDRLVADADGAELDDGARVRVVED